MALHKPILKTQMSTSELTFEAPSLDQSVESLSSVSPPPPKWAYSAAPPYLSRPSSGLSLSDRGYTSVVQPEVLQDHLVPVDDHVRARVLEARQKLSGILAGNSDFLVVAGPTYVTDAQQLKACAQWVAQASPDLTVSLRANMTRYNTENPDIANPSVMTYEIHKGLPYCRALLRDVAEVCPVVGEISDTITPQYLSDLYSLSLVSSTFVESQLHRELVSGVSFPTGFNSQDSNLPFDKDMYPHRVGSALDAMYASSQRHQFLSVTKTGQVAVIGTTGNDETFIILELNLQVSLAEIKVLVQKIYNYSLAKYTTPKVLLDLGKISNTDYDAKLGSLQEILNTADLRATIIGVLIDSGDSYIPNEEVSEPMALTELNNYLQSKINGSEQVKLQQAVKPDGFEYLINAERIIRELGSMDLSRRE